MDTTVTSAGPLTADGLTEQMWRDVLVQLRGFVRRRIADPVRVEDLVGEILLRIHQNLDSIGDRERLANWVFRVARNAIVDEYRRAARARERLVPTLVEGAVEERASDAEDEPGVLEELAGCLRPLLGGLPVEQRRAVELIDLDGVPQARAAQDEGVSLSGMKSRVQRGRRRLGELLGQCCALTLDARGMPMEYVAPQSCDCGR
jgi:RNA polymerase sigma-70 factor (ECF subfamily)